MEFSSLFFYLLFFGPIFQLSNTIVSSAKLEISEENAPTDKLDSLTGQMNEKNADIKKRLVQQRIKRDTDDGMDDNMGIDTNHEPIPQDVVYIDHRSFGCLDVQPRNQGNCDASYAFATVAFHEWLNCKRTRNFKAFSEQFIIDCSHSHDNNGCAGGNPMSAMIFVDDYGVRLRENYPYTGVQRNCPIRHLIHARDMRYSRTARKHDPIVTFIPLDELEEHLMYGPIIVIVEISIRFLSYTGGVDDNVDHDPRFLHTMLLIGHGRENGKEYWLFKNSYGPNWVGHGYYKLNKNVDCFSGEFGIGASGPISNE